MQGVYSQENGDKNIVLIIYVGNNWEFMSGCRLFTSFYIGFTLDFTLNKVLIFLAVHSQENRDKNIVLIMICGR